MDEKQHGRIKILHPHNLEEALIAVGIKEQNSDVDILITTELFADICVRLLRLEDKKDISQIGL